MKLLVPTVSVMITLTLLAIGYLIGRRSRPSYVVFLPTDRPIPVSSQSWQLAVEESGIASTAGQVHKGSARIVRFVLRAIVVALAVIGIAALILC